MEIAGVIRQVKCPFCSQENSYSVSSNNVGRGVKVIKCSSCNGNMFMIIKTDRGELSIEGPKVLHIG